MLSYDRKYLWVYDVFLVTDEVTNSIKTHTLFQSENRMKGYNLVRSTFLRDIVKKTFLRDSKIKIVSWIKFLRTVYKKFNFRKLFGDLWSTDTSRIRYGYVLYPIPTLVITLNELCDLFKLLALSTCPYPYFITGDSLNN